MKADEQFVKLLFLLAKRTNYELEDFEADMIAGSLRDFGWECVNAALSDFIKGMRLGEKFPSINEIRAKCVRIKGISEGGVQDSRHLAEKCWTAVGRFGYTNPKEAEHFLGPVCWAMIERHGGWKSFCESAGTVDQKSYLIPQWAKSLEQQLENQRLNDFRLQLEGRLKLQLTDGSEE